MEETRRRIGEAFADYFKEVIYGGIDGIVTTFAVVVGFAGAAISNEETTQLTFVVVLLFGLANLFADAASMGLGNFLSVRSEKDLYRVKRETERQRLVGRPESEIVKTKMLLERQQFAPDDAAALAHIYQRNDEYWLDFIMHHELRLTDPRAENEVFTGLATFLSFMVFGTIPLLPFMVKTTFDPSLAFLYSSLGTFIALVLLGLLKWRVLGARCWASLAEVVLVGGTAAVLAYFVGTFFVV
jgi:VIT1/CCC1 family predicted Fe2+/Mn2+ transporter